MPDNNPSPISDPPPSTLLLTGFEPFGEHGVNPSWLVAEALDGYRPPRARVMAARLPVNWLAALPALEPLLAQQPAWVILLGLAGRATTIRVEMQAANVAGPRIDNAGALPPAAVLDTAGPAARISTLPGPRLVAAIQAAGLPAALSTDAGQYLCNFTLYHALAWAARQPTPPPVGFIHLPPLALPGLPGLSLADAIRAVRVAIDTLIGDGGQGVGVGDLFSRDLSNELGSEREAGFCLQ